MTARRFESCKRLVYTARLSQCVFVIAPKRKRVVRASGLVFMQNKPARCGNGLENRVSPKAMGFVSSVLRHMLD